MITTYFTGNLGNGLIQYNLIREIAHRANLEFGFTKRYFFDYYGGKLQSDFLNLDYGYPVDINYGETKNFYMWREKKISNYVNGDYYDYHPFQNDVFESPKDNTIYVFSCGQDARYFDINHLKEWNQIKKENVENYNKVLEYHKINLEDENLCVINVRGGEYVYIPNLILDVDYWKKSIEIMIDKNPKVYFAVVTDDVDYARQILPKMNVYHFTIGLDYYIINHAKNLILSNSSFAIIPSVTNPNNPFIIAPKYWARYNVSNGYWASSDIWTFSKWGFNFMNREGKLFSYSENGEEKIL